LEQARIQLPAIAAHANAGVASVITRHGRPYAAIVPIHDLKGARPVTGILSLRGTGRGLWPSPAKAIAKLRDEWGEA
jgi:antitoxin (DNA-binding transcriptional repressor) of toxin-antitoxin stability system